MSSADLDKMIEDANEIIKYSDRLSFVGGPVVLLDMIKTLAQEVKDLGACVRELELSPINLGPF